jgi:hypothetical protein
VPGFSIFGVKIDLPPDQAVSPESRNSEDAILEGIEVIPSGSCCKVLALIVNADNEDQPQAHRGPQVHPAHSLHRGLSVQASSTV